MQSACGKVSHTPITIRGLSITRLSLSLINTKRSFRCGQHIGLFINFRKCTVLYLHDSQGSWHTAPYLDQYGEVDLSLRLVTVDDASIIPPSLLYAPEEDPNSHFDQRRRNRQLFLNQKRYDALLRNVWLQHNIPTTISRRLEADINNGGWESI